MNLFKPEEIKLSNGIPVILQHREAPVGTFHWWNFTGSTDEDPTEAGFAHFLEHMLFKDAAAKDTGQASDGKMARAIESLGGEINAYTSFDQTVYHVTCSEQYWESVMDVFGTMAKPQRFLKSDFDREKEVILEELRRGQDSPDRQLYEKLFGLTYQKHPYGRPVIGYESILKKATVSQLETFYRRNYVSSQMGLVLVGPIHDSKGARKKKLLSVLEKRFGKSVIPQRAAIQKIRPTEKALRKGPTLKATHFDIKNPEIAFSFRIPELLHPDVPGLEVLAGVLGMGEVSRLYQKLFYDRSLVTDVSASTYVPRDSGMFLTSFDLKNTSDLPEVIRTWVETLLEIRGQGPSKQEIDRVITNLESEKMYSMQTVDGLANRLGFLRFSLGDLHFDHDYLEQLKQTQPRTLQRLTEEYLTAERMSAVCSQPKGEALFDFGSLTDQFKKISTSPQKRILTKVKTPTLDPFVYETAEGLKVSIQERIDSPVFSIYFSSLGGTRLEFANTTGDSHYWGISHLLAQTWKQGTSKHTAKQISQLIEGSAASLDGFSGRNTIGLQMTGLVRDWDMLSNLFTEVLFDPSFDQGELEHSKRVTRDLIHSIPDHSSQMASKLFMENLFVNHPYGKHTLGSIENVDRLQSNDLKTIHSQWVMPRSSSLSVVTGVPFEQIKPWIDELSRHWLHHRNDLKGGENLPILPEPKMGGPRWAEAHFGREQTHLLVGGLGLSLFDETRFAQRLLQNILGGQSGRLFIELREKKSMAYTVSPMAMEGLEPGYVGTYIACAPAKTKEAIAGMRNVLETLAKKGPTAAEMKRAKNYALGQRAMDLQSSWSVAASNGLELLYRGKIELEKNHRKNIEHVTDRQVKNVCEKIWVHAPQLTVTIS